MIETIPFEKHSEKKIVIALGFFDCVHIGHRFLLSKCVESAKKLDCSGAAFTFDNNPQLFYKGNTARKLIYNFNQRLHLLENCGINSVFYARFDKDFCEMTADEFLKVLFSHNVAGVVCGEDYTFGKGAVGNAERLAIECQRKKIDFLCVPQITYQNRKVSTTEICDFIISGEIATANKLLGAPYRYSGQVSHGHGVGRQIGFATANLSINPDLIAPACGVYCGYAEIDGLTYKAIINVGNRPTFKDEEKKIEAHLIGFDGNLYGKTITLNFLRFLREIRKFDNQKELSEQLAKDTAEATNG